MDNAKPKARPIVIKSNIFPSVFETGIIGEGETEKSLCASALCGWANCMIGNKPPELFGMGMAAIGKRLGINPTADNIEKYIEDKGWLKSKPKSEF